MQQETINTIMPKFLEDRDVACVVRESELEGKDILDMIDSIDIEAISKKIENLELIKPDGAKQIAPLLESLT